MSGLFDVPGFFPDDLPMDGAEYVVSALGGIIGPFADRSEAVDWAQTHVAPGCWAVEELVRPEDAIGQEVVDPEIADEEATLPGLE